MKGCQKQYYTYLVKVLAKDKYIDTHLIVIYVLTSSTMSVDYVEFEFQNKMQIALCKEISLSHENKARIIVLWLMHTEYFVDVP